MTSNAADASDTSEASDTLVSSFLNAVYETCAPGIGFMEDQSVLNSEVRHCFQRKSGCRPRQLTDSSSFRETAEALHRYHSSALPQRVAVLVEYF